ncbi:MAG TPA: flagellar hook-length control protein FliK [Rickettsiales bacterium]|nr:flagellar hook-length control protein FliK [Rickettsiales bacterium]
MSNNIAPVVISLPPVNAQTGGQSQTASDVQNNSQQDGTVGASGQAGNMDTGSHFSKMLNSVQNSSTQQNNNTHIQNNHSQSQSGSKASQTSSQASQQGQKTDNGNNDNTTTNNNDNNNLTARSNTGAAPADNSNADVNSNSSDNTETDNTLNDIAQVILLAQAGSGQVGTQDDAQPQADASSSISTQDQSLLQQLQQLLQELLQKASSFGQGTQTASATATDTAQTNTPSDTQQPDTGKDLSKDSDALAQMMSQLMALLQQLSQQPNAQALSSELNSMTITSDGQSAATVLTELAQSLQKQFANTADTGDTATATTNSDSSGIPIPQASDAINPFDKMISSLIDAAKSNLGKQGSGNSQAKQSVGGDTLADATNIVIATATDSSKNSQADQLQSAISDLMQILTSPQDGKGAGTSSSSNQDSNAIADTANMFLAAMQAHNAAHNTMPVANTVKFGDALHQPATPVSEQVLVQIRNAAEGSSLIRIQLEPADLGKVEVQMSTTADGKTSISITADNRQTMAMLQNEAKSLESALRNIGIKTDSGGLNFSLNQQQNGNNNNGNNAAGYTKVAAVGGIEDDAEIGTINASYQLTVNTGLDIRV